MTGSTAATTRQTKPERLRAALLRSWRTRSDREIAKTLGVSNRTVLRLRKQLEAEGAILPRGESTQTAEACLCEVCTSTVER